MTKIGEGNTPPKQATAADYNKQIDAGCTKFMNAAALYETESSAEERTHLKQIMDQQLALIQSAVKEMQQKPGLHEVEGKVVSDYQSYLSGKGGEESFAALQHDLQTLKDYTHLSQGGGVGSEKKNPRS